MSHETKDRMSYYQDYQHECVVLTSANPSQEESKAFRNPLLDFTDPLRARCIEGMVCSTRQCANPERQVARKIYSATRIITPEEALENPRCSRSGTKIYKKHLIEYFGEELLESLKGKTIIVPYLDLGLGHRNQAEDACIVIASALGVNVVFTSPLANVSEEERFMFNLKGLIHKTMQNGGNVNTAAETYFNNSRCANTLGRNIQKNLVSPMLGLASRVIGDSDRPEPSSVSDNNDSGNWQSITGRIGSVHELRLWLSKQLKGSSDRFMNGMMKKLENDPKFAKRIFGLFTKMDSSLSEKPLARVLECMVKDFDACAIVSTHTAALRKVNIPNIPVISAILNLIKHKKKPSKESVIPLISAIPDLGYIPRARDPNMDGLTVNGMPDIFGAATLLEPFLASDTPINYTVADGKVHNALTMLGIAEDRIWETGTICDSITPEDFKQKWLSDERRFLMSVNGNASNVQHMMNFFRDIATGQDQSWRSKNYKFKVFLADRAELDENIARKKEELISIISEHQLSDYVEIIETKAVEKYNTSEIRQELQRWAHVEWRTPGENILTGGNVGCCEVGMPAGKAENEKQNLLAMTRARQALAGSYPIASHNYWADFYNSKGISPLEYEDYGLSSEPITTAAGFLAQLFDKNDGEEYSLAERVAREGFLEMDKDANFRISAILSYLILKPNKSRESLLELMNKVSAQHKERNRRSIEN